MMTCLMMFNVALTMSASSDEGNLLQKHDFTARRSNVLLHTNWNTLANDTVFHWTTQCPINGHNAGDCVQEFNNAVQNNDKDAFCTRCKTETGDNPLRKRCSKCCTECPCHEESAQDLCNEGGCETSATGYNCKCSDTDFNGNRCEIWINDCDPVDWPDDTPWQKGVEETVCGPHGTCTDGKRTYTCGCQEGFTGKHCEPEVLEEMPAPPPSPTYSCGDWLSAPVTHPGDCIAEYNNFKQNGDLDGFCDRCSTEGGNNPLRKRCTLCNEKCPCR